MKKNKMIHWSFVMFVLVISMACSLPLASPGVDQPPDDNPPVEVEPTQVVEEPVEPSAEPPVETEPTAEPIDEIEPPVATEAPPPAPTAPRVESSVIDGLCAPGNGTLFDCEVVVNEEGIVQVRLQLNGVDVGRDDGVDSVSFTVFTTDGNEVFSTTEENAPYCIFGDSDGECSSWQIEDGVYQWPSGIPLEAGNYEVSVQVNLRDDPTGIFWKGSYDVSFP